MAKKRVVVTGAAGYVAQRMLPELRERWDLVLLDVRPTTRDGKTVPGLMVADLTKPDRNEYRQHFRGADAVIHCGFVSAPRLDATTWQDNSDAKFWAEHTNVGLAYNVCRVASRRACGAWWCAAPITRPTTTSGSSGTAVSTW